MKRLPFLPTLLVALAVATMIGLGVWQLQRKAEKEALLAQYRSALSQPELPELPQGLFTRHDVASFAASRKAFDQLLFRKARVRCTLLGDPGGAPPVLADGTTQIQIAGRNRAGDTGYRHIQSCSTEPFQGRILVDLGWSRGPLAVAIPQRSVVLTGRLVPAYELTDRMEPDRESDPIPLMLVADQPWLGLERSAPPALGSIPNNHLFYAAQWFFFAAAAAVIYVLALRRRTR